MNKMEQLRVERLVRLGCVACAWLDIPNATNIEVHHLLHGGRRMGDWFTIPLCAGHHRGDFTPEQKQILAPHQLVAISSGRKLFASVYPDERMLWEIIQERLGLAWPSPKIVPRRVA